MATTVETTVKDDYIICTLEGTIDTYKEYDDVHAICAGHILRNGKTKAVIDVRAVKMKQSPMMQTDIVDSYDALPEQILSLRLAVISNESQLEYEKFWEFLVQEKNLDGKVFLTMDEAVAFITA